jgi:hypothetical protein
MDDPPFYKTAGSRAFCFIFNTVLLVFVVASVSAVVMKIIKNKLDSSVRFFLSVFAASFSLRSTIWTLIMIEVQQYSGSQVVELIYAITVHLFILSLYYFTLEMEAVKTIL